MSACGLVSRRAKPLRAMLRSMKSGTGWKTCPRGHKFREAGLCPVCNPGKRKKK